MKDQFGLGKMRTKLHDLSLFQHCCPEPRLANGCAFPTVQLLACLRPSRVTLALTPTQPSPAVPPVHAVPQVAVRTDLLCGGALPCRCTRRKLDHKEALSGRAPSLQSPRLRQARDCPCAPPTGGHCTPFSQCASHLLARRALLQGQPPLLSALSPVCVLRRTFLRSCLQCCPDKDPTPILPPASSGIMSSLQLLWTAPCICFCHLSLSWPPLDPGLEHCLHIQLTIRAR